MFKIDLKSKKSIYEQIIDGFKDEIICGKLSADEKIPSVREMASQLTVNPNTIQKAYAELEKQGFIYSLPGRGNFVSAKSFNADPRQLEEIYSRIEDMLKELKYLGVSDRDVRYKLMAMTTDRAEVRQGSLEKRGGGND